MCRLRRKTNKEAKSQMKAGRDKTNDSSDTPLDSQPYRQNESPEVKSSEFIPFFLSLNWLFTQGFIFKTADVDKMTLSNETSCFFVGAFQLDCLSFIILMFLHSRSFDFFYLIFDHSIYLFSNLFCKGPVSGEGK